MDSESKYWMCDLISRLALRNVSLKQLKLKMHLEGFLWKLSLALLIS